MNLTQDELVFLQEVLERFVSMPQYDNTPIKAIHAKVIAETLSPDQIIADYWNNFKHS
jgi:hypothetical protein